MGSGRHGAFHLWSSIATSLECVGDDGMVTQRSDMFETLQDTRFPNNKSWICGYSSIDRAENEATPPKLSPQKPISQITEPAVSLHRAKILFLMVRMGHSSGVERCLLERLRQEVLQRRGLRRPPLTVTPEALPPEVASVSRSTQKCPGGLNLQSSDQHENPKMV